MEASIFLIFTLLLGGGQGNDLLDLIPSDAYWKSKDVEVTAANIMLELNSLKPDDTSKATAVRRLMAIRTLGELKSPDTLNTLKSQLDNKDMFVAEYAQRAIDAIEGRAPTKSAGVPPDRMKQDLYMLPEHCGAVGQVKLMSGKPMVLPKAKEGEDPAPGVDPRAAMEQWANSLIYIAEMTGNIRVDGVTAGVSDDVGEQQGFVVMYVRGQWDADAIKSALQTQFNQTRTIGETEFMCPQDAQIIVAVPSNDLFVMSSGPNFNNIPADDVGSAVKTGKGKFENSADMIKLLSTIDTNAQSWVAMLVSDSYRQATQLAPFDHLTFTGKATATGMEYQATGQGKDVDAVKAGVDDFTNLINQAKGELTQQTDRIPTVQPLIDFFNTIELKADGTNATGTATMKKPAQ
jgi:hypothetical protein